MKTQGRRVEVSRGGTSERFAPKTFHGIGSSRGQSIFRDAETSRGRKGSKICATLHEKRKTPKKYKKESRASRDFTFHTYTFFKGTYICCKSYTVGV